ncbi:MAG: tellurite resistance/C4-dicarboxylate transporter family protein [Nocardioides sp.]|nr:tellurite resistance/C4-dicarboxylate transporter family protein [Nocardioides sp.]
MTPLLRRVDESVRVLTPGYFALVMATGIISVGLRLLDHEWLSGVLLVIALVAFVVLVLLTAWRLVKHRDAVVEDFLDPRRAFGFFTTIAGTNVVGVRLAMEGYHVLTAICFAVAVALWLVLGYVIPWTAVLGPHQRPILATANGTWFIWVVASQSVAIAAATLQRTYGGVGGWLAIAAVFSWSVGVFLYAAAGIFVAARIMLYDFAPTDLNPPYWVAMGASAITVLAGARIVEMSQAPMIDVTRDLIAGLSVIFWAFATWLIPVLVAAGAWRHLHHRVPLRYEATLWSIIFPLGMYAVAGIYLGQADALPIVGAIGSGWIWLALGAWALTFVAMLRNTVAVLRPAVGVARPAA